jgi:hypothetical protein
MALALPLALATSCAQGGVTPASSPVTPSPNVVASFAAWEEAWTTELAAIDPRLARRVRIQPKDADTGRAALTAILAEDPGLRVHGQQADLFSFDTRAREVATLAKTVAVAPRTDPKELELVLRLIDEERARVDEERQMPRSGSELLRGVVTTWSAPSSMAEGKTHDAWLAARVGDLLATLAPEGSLTATEISELEDAIDPLEHLANPGGYPETQGAIARLRVALGRSRAAAQRGLGWEVLHSRLVVHVGMVDGEPTLRSDLVRVEALLRAEANAALVSLGDVAARAVLQRTEGHLLVERESDAHVEGSRARGFGSPPERAFIGSHLHALVESGAESEASALVLLHDAVALASWALAIHVDGLDPAEAPHGRTLLSDVPPERIGRLVRSAAVRPVACLALLRTATLLEGGGPNERRARASRWIAYGDAPLDVVARDLGWR